MDELMLAKEKAKAKAMAQRMHREKLDRRDRMAAELEHPRKPPTKDERLRYFFGDAFGIEPRRLSLGGEVPFAQQVQGGFMTNVAPEEAAYLKKQYPGAPVVSDGEYAAVLPPGAEQPLFFNPPGAQFGDVTRTVAREAPVIGGGAAAGFASGGNPIAIAGGAAMGRGAQETAQAAYGTSRETVGDVFMQMILSGALEGAGAALPILKTRLGGALRRRGEAQLLEAFDPGDLTEAMTYLAAHPDIDLPNLTWVQMRDIPALDNIARQALQFSKKDQLKMEAQMKSAVQGLRNSMANSSEVDSLVQKAASEVGEMQQRALLGPEPDLGAAGERMIGRVDPQVNRIPRGEGALSQAIDVRRQGMKAAFSERDRLVEELNPRYSLTGVQDSIVQRRKDAALPALPVPKETEESLEQLNKIFGEGTFTPQAVNDYISIGTNNEQLARVEKLIERIDPEQDHAIVDLLRQRVGAMLDQPALRLQESDTNIGAARHLYRALSEAQTQPTNLTPEQAAPLVSKTKAANEATQRYHSTFDLDAVAKAEKQREKMNPVTGFRAFVDNPSQVPKAVGDMFDELVKDSSDAGRAMRDQVRTDMRQAILYTDQPVRTLAKWGKEQPEMADWIFGGREQFLTAKRNAQLLKDINTPSVQDAMKTQVEKVGFAEKFIDEQARINQVAGSGAAANMERLKQTVRQTSGAAGEKALRDAVWSRILQNAYGVEHGEMRLSLDGLLKGIDKAMRNGTYEGILTEADRKTLEALKPYVRRLSDMGDNGVGLAVASQMGQVRHGDPGAIANILWTRRLAGALTDERPPWEALFMPAGKITEKKAAGPIRKAATAVARAGGKAGLALLRQGPLKEALSPYLEWESPPQQEAP